MMKYLIAGFQKNVLSCIDVCVIILPLKAEVGRMYEILIGNKKDNVFHKLQNSWTARIMFAGCCWYLYDLFGRSNGLRIEVIFLIFIMGILLMNLFYIPFRMLGNKKISYRIKLLFIVVADIVALYFFNATEQLSLACTWKNMISGVIISLCVTGIIATLYRCSAVHLQRKRFMRKDFDNMEGWEFEEFCGNVLRRNGFEKVTVTSRSGDFGIDVIAYKDNVKYGIQCKRYEGAVGWHAVEEARAGAEYWRCQRAVVLTNSTFTKQALEGAGRIGVELWDRDWLISNLK